MSEVACVDDYLYVFILCGQLLEYLDSSISGRIIYKDVFIVIIKSCHYFGYSLT